MSPVARSEGQSKCPSEDTSEDTRGAEPSAKSPRLEEAACNVKQEYASSCCIPTTWRTYPLLNVQRYNHDTSIFEFGLQAGQSLNLPVCACIMMANEPATDEPEEIRPYTSISDNSMLGKFQVLIKRYPAWGSPDFVYNYKPPGKMSNYVHNLSIGDVVRFKHMPDNVKRSYPFTGVRTITMLAVGVGIAPMLRVLRAVLTTPEDTTQVVFLYGNRTVQDILMKEQLDEWAGKHQERFKMVYVVGTRWKVPIIGAKTANPIYPAPPDGFETLTNGVTVGIEGWISEENVKKLAFPPADDTQVLVCGLPSVYESLCGPQSQKSLAPMSVLARLGYSQDMVYKF